MSDTMTKIVRAERRRGASAAGWKQSRCRAGAAAAPAPCLAARPERMRELMAALDTAGRPHAVRPWRRPQLWRRRAQQRRRRVLTGRLDRILAFDAATGLARCRAGRHLRRPAGALPAARLARAGLAGHRLRHPGRRASPTTCMARTTTAPAASATMCCGSTCCCRMARCCASRRTSDPALFRATIGGIGLTGIITAICLRLMPVPSNALARAPPRASAISTNSWPASRQRPAATCRSAGSMRWRAARRSAAASWRPPSPARQASMLAAAESRSAFRSMRRAGR